MFGFYRVAAAAPELKVADIEFNTSEIIRLAEKADKNSASVLLFPELSISAYTCGDLFFQSALLDKIYTALQEICKASAKLKTALVIGAPLQYRNALYNCGIVIQNGNILGAVPKSFIPNYREFYEKRWFTSGAALEFREIEINGKTVPFGTNLIFSSGRYFKFCIELCEDLWSAIPPSSYHSIAGSLISLNLSASNELVSKYEYRKALVRQQSARCISAYVYASSGVGESTTDLVFSGHSIIAENGALLTENKRFERESSLIFADIDCEKLLSLRSSESSFSDSPQVPEHIEIKLGDLNSISEIKRSFSQTPFVPAEQEKRSERCMEIIKIQSAGLSKRISHTSAKKLVIGISGGLDSTLALLVSNEAAKLSGLNPENIIAVTMPGFGTTGRTYNNALNLCRSLGVSIREIKIKDACLLHFKDIGHDPAKHDVTYENVQARERTQLLMDIANKEGGLVVGTGDLSEIALGWSTYNGDHISMYAVNCGVPKTLVRYLIQWVAEQSGNDLKKVLLDIIDTPVSPELLPASANGEINQKTEDIIGPYELHDFFLYHMLKYGAAPEKILYLAETAFKNKYVSKEIRKHLAFFIKRFFSQQFKRSCIPDGPKVGTISLSPRGDWRMPSDAVPSSWLNGLEDSTRS